VLKTAVAATRTVPIVMVATDYDPLALGYVASLARPGGNVTGVFMQQIELTPKRLELLTQTVPELARVVVLWDRFSADQFEAAREAARILKIPLEGIECADPPYDYQARLICHSPYRMPILKRRRSRLRREGVMGTRGTSSRSFRSSWRWASRARWSNATRDALSFHRFVLGRFNGL
jgi:hypothetical protein